MSYDGYGEEARVYRETMLQIRAEERAEKRGRRKGIKRGRELERKQLESEYVLVEIVGKSCDPNGDTLTIKLINGMCVGSWTGKAHLSRIEG